MSRYAEFTTEFRERRHLCAALDALGFKYEVHEEPWALYDYHSNPRPEKAEVIIRRQHTGLSASNDIGFARQPDGTYKAIISEYDRGLKFGESWLGRLKQEYKVSKRIEVGENQGYVLIGREEVASENGIGVRLRFGVR